MMRKQNANGMTLGKTVGEIPHHFSICTFSDSNNELLHSSLPHIKIKHTDCSNCSGKPHHCTLLHLSKWMVNPTTAHYSISASGWSTPPLHTTPSQQVHLKASSATPQAHRNHESNIYYCTLKSSAHLQLHTSNLYPWTNPICNIQTHTYIYIKCTKLTTVFSVAQRRNDLTSRQLEGTSQRLEFTDGDVRLFVYAQTLTTTRQSQLHLLYSIIVP